MLYIVIFILGGMKEMKKTIIVENLSKTYRVHEKPEGFKNTLPFRRL